MSASSLLSSTTVIVCRFHRRQAATDKARKEVGLASKEELIDAQGGVTYLADGGKAKLTELLFTEEVDKSIAQTSTEQLAEHLTQGGFKKK